jgi:hypothetical protein
MTEALTDLGSSFATALAAKDPAAVRAVMAADLDFRAMTPRRFWEANDHQELLEVLFDHWLDPGDEVLALLWTTTGEVSTRRHVAYRLQLRTPAGEALMEQQMYYETRGGRIHWARLMCSGAVPLR